MKKNILHIVSSAVWRGCEQQVEYLFNASNEQFQNYIFCPEGAELVRRNVQKRERIFTYKKRFGFDLFAAFELKKVCKQHQIDLIHLHDSHAINTYLLADLFGMDIPAIIHRHNNISVHSKWKYNNSKTVKIIAVSEEVKKTLSKLADPSKIIVVYPGIDVEKFTNNNEASTNNKLKQELNIPADKKLIGVVCAIEKEKNIDEFISIAKKIVDKNNEYHFVITGDGSLLNTLQESSSNYQQNIHFTGFRNDVAQILPCLDLFLFTSKSEGFPLVLLEAMAAKVPIVCSNFPSATEIIQPSETGFIYKNTEEAITKIESLNTQVELRNTITENAHKYVQQFDVISMSEKIKKVYMTIFSDKNE